MFENRLFSVLRGYFFSRIGRPQTFREDLILRKLILSKINQLRYYYYYKVMHALR